jgi:hypothetical protein
MKDGRGEGDELLEAVWQRPHMSVTDISVTDLKIKRNFTDLLARVFGTLRAGQVPRKLISG